MAKSPKSSVARVRRCACRAQRLDARHRALGLVLLAVALQHAHRLAVAEVAPQLLLEELRVGRDHRVGRAQDVAGAAVVLLQRDDLELRVVLRQPLQVVDGGAAPAVDALVVVAHGGEGRARRPAPSAARTARRWCPGTRPPARGRTAPASARALRRRAAAAPAAGRSGRRSPPPGRPPAAPGTGASRARPRARRRWRRRPRRRRRPGPGSSTG
jgi:hypothetical protein